MKKTPCVSSASEVSPKHPYRNLMKAALLSTALGNGALACASPQVMPSTPTPAVSPIPAPTSASASAKNEIENSPQETKSSEISEDIKAEVIQVIIEERAPQIWPDVPVKCVFTGIVLDHDQLSEPHKILLENMCVQKREELKNVFEGKHRWISSDAEGNYQIPFLNSHVEERGADLIFVTGQGAGQVAKPLEPGPYEPNTLSFGPFLDTYQVRAIKE